MKVVAYDPYVQPAPRAQLGVRLLPLDELLARVRLHHDPHAEDPRDHRADRRRRAAQVKPTVRIVNVARGGLIDEDALYVALKEGRVAGAGLDVFAERAVHRLAALRARERRRHPAPRRLDRRGAGEGRRLGRALGAPRARGRARARRRQRRRAASSPRRAPGHPAHREARPGLRRPRRRAPLERRRRGARRDRRVRRQGARARGPQGRLLRRRRASRCPTSTRRCSPASAASRCASSPTPRAADYRNLITLRGTLADGSPGLGRRHPHRHQAARSVVEINGYDVEVPSSASTSRS